jgi:hypothetical protein
MPKLSATDAKELEYRSIPRVILLIFITLLIGYPIYLCYQWARELNGLLQEKRHAPRLVLLLSLVTLGVGAVVYECIFASELERHFHQRGRADAMPHLTTWIVTLNVICFLGAITGLGAIVAIPCGIAATCLV